MTTDVQSEHAEEKERRIKDLIVQLEASAREMKDAAATLLREVKTAHIKYKLQADAPRDNS